MPNKSMGRQAHQAPIGSAKQSPGRNVISVKQLGNIYSRMFATNSTSPQYNKNILVMALTGVA